MMDINEVREALKGERLVESPFHLVSNIAKICVENVELGRELVIRALDSELILAHGYREIIDELAMQVGLYPYVESLSDLSLRSAMMHAAHRADGEMSDFVIHSAQAKVLRKLMAGESVILSAPTSFGKSLLVDLLISAKDFLNIVLIVPTLALVEETRRRVSRFVDRYSIVTSASQKIEERNIFVLTQERFLSIEGKLPAVDFFVIDEFYKLSISGEGDRATLLNQAFLALSRTGAQFYLLGPSIKAIPEEVYNKVECSFVVENFQTVAVELHHVKKKPNKALALAGLLDRLDGQTMIYCQSPSSTRTVLSEYLENRELQQTSDEELIEAADWTAKHYHHDWLVSVGLKYGIGIHHGRLPRSLGRFMVRAFEEGKLNILLCTSTLIEGVNTAAKNVVIYDNKLNRKPLDFFTFNNIKGRSGRMFRHFVGNVYLFEAPPEEDLPFVDIPALNPTDATPSSLLLQMSKDDLPSGLEGKVERLTNQNFLPVAILKAHSGIEPEYLIDTAKYLRGLDIRSLMQCSWIARPTYDELRLSSEIIWEKLGGAQSARRAAMRTSSMMTKWIWDLFKLKSVPVFRKQKIINQMEYGLAADEAVENVLAFIRGWASFNYPKYLSALNDVAAFVLAARGLRGCNYIPFAASIEHLFQPDSFSSLEEYGLPTEITERLMQRKLFGKDESLDIVIQRLRGPELNRYADGLFEKRIIEDFQSGIGVKKIKKP
ncbi:MULTISPECIES: DEAD/DEAH box helicase [unclassified Pseudomonas]|uniref:DEAD/DEAH box helicase n=1 Tax=unclassified Pseudomonas TaxID=196821 RepID=UPI000D36D5A5|nr:MULTISPECIES: DEAD/DEAH box helicase [unclassified Pseudomonas]RAU45205.1 helicase [Pseudomonas sp. RIT 409]RAU51345.1 helicase [Pseudomonas sp. RIT 412]